MVEFRWTHEPALPRIPGYALLGRLGQGAQASVFHARHELTQREVALKVVYREGLTPRSEARFAREAELLAQLAHPGVIRVHQWGETPELVFLDCELVRGARTLVQACADLDLDAQLALFEALFDALSAVHDLGVLHRDLKPDNVLVSQEGRLELVDFGIARAQGQERLTETGRFVGTLLYAAPERLEPGRPEAEQPPVDVWSAAAVCFEALTGRPPYPASSLPELAGLALEPCPPLGSLRPDLPPRLQRAIDGALEHRPEARLTAAQTLATLRGTAPGRRRWPAVAIAGGALASAVALAALPGLSTNEAPPPVPAAPPNEAALTERQAQLVAGYLATGEGAEALAAQLGEDRAVELLAEALLPPRPAQPTPPPEWLRLGARLAAGRSHLARAVARAQTGAPWERVADALDAGRRAQPDAPWDALQALLARERGVAWDPPPDRGDPGDALRALARALRPGARPELDALAQGSPDPDVRELAAAHLVLASHAANGAPAERVTAARAAADYGHLRATLDLERANADPAGAVELLDDARQPGAGLLYAPLIAERARLVLLALTRRHPLTPLSREVAARFLRRTWEQLPQSTELRQRVLTAGLWACPQLRDVVLAQAGPLELLRSTAQVVAPLPCHGAPLPPEWEARVAALPPPQADLLRDAVTRGMLGAPWSEVVADLNPAIARTPGDDALPIARALLWLARQPDAAVSLDEVTDLLPPAWRGFVRARWRGEPLAPELEASVGLEFAVEQALRAGDRRRLRQLAPRHGRAALAPAPAAEVAEDALRRLDAAVRSYGCLDVELLARRTHAAWRWAREHASPDHARYALRWPLEFAPDGPGLLLALDREPELRPWLDDPIRGEGRAWVTSPRGLRLLALHLDPAEAGRPRQIGVLLTRAHELDPDAEPSPRELELRRRVFGSAELPR